MKGYGTSDTTSIGSHLLHTLEFFNGFCNHEEGKSTSLKLMCSQSMTQDSVSAVLIKTPGHVPMEVLVRVWL